MSDKKEEKGGGYFEYTLLTMVGTQLVVSIFLGFGFGYWVDKKFGTAPIMMLLFGGLGICSGFLNIYRTIVDKTKD